MKGRVIAAQLAAAGLDELELPGKTRLYDSALTAFHHTTGIWPDYICWVPGRLEVFGTHTDYAGGRTLIAPVPRGFAFTGIHRTDRQVRVVDAVAGESVTIGTHGPAPRLTGWRQYVEVVVERLARNFPGAPLGADIAFASDLPRAAGMSSSSALIVGVASALVRLSGIRERAEWRTWVAHPVDEAGYYACIENGRTFGGLTGDAGVGTHGGSEDHAAMICGEPGALSAYAFVPMRRIDAVGLPADWRIVIASSGVAAEKTGAALDAYNRLSRGAAILHDLWNRLETPAASLASALASGPSAAARLQSIVRTVPVDEWPPESLEARLQHFVREDGRIPDAVRAFRDRDAASLNKLAGASQLDSENLLGNQVDQTVALTRLGLEQGAFATRSFGAGFGGSVWALIERDRTSTFAQRWLDAYRELHPGAAKPVAFEARPGPPVTELRL